ncbi:MAG: acyltransferase [Lachnospiraceae bacterium]|nr:acyltransferase [Lachnospiraceae bacterium]
MSKEISNKIKVYSLFFILVIFTYHSDIKFNYHLYAPISILGPCGLSFFFMSSGYFMFKGATVEKIRGRSLKRIKTLMVPYLFWNVVFYLYYVISDVYYRNVPISKLLYRFFFQPFDDVLWYLFALFVFAMLAWPAMYVMQKKKSAIVFLLAVTAVVLTVCIVFAEEVVAIQPVGWWFVKVFPYAPMYFFGGFLALHLDKLKVENFKYSWIFFILSVLIVVLKYKFDYVLFFGWALLFLFPLVFWQAFPENMFGNSKLIGFLCDPSFFIYEFQLMAMWIWQDIWLGHISDGRPYHTAVYLCAIVFSYALYYVTKLVAPWLLDIATGYRSGK